MSYRRNRRSYINLHRTKYETFTRKDCIKVMDAYHLLKLKADHIARLLKTVKKPRWDSPASVAKSLRRLLHNYAFWLSMRHFAIDLHEKVNEMVDAVKTRINAHCRWAIETCLDNQYPGTIKSENFEVRDVNPQGYEEFHAVIQQCNQLHKDLEMLYLQCRELYQMPAWKELKPHACHGTRTAVSMALACETGKEDMNKAHYHALFGWHEKAAPSDPIFARIRRVIRNLNGRIREPNGIHPNLTEGRRYLTSSYYVRMPNANAIHATQTDRTLANYQRRQNRPTRENTDSLSQLLANLLSTGKSLGIVHLNEAVFRTSGIEDRLDSPVLVRYTRQQWLKDGGRAIRIRNGIVRKIMQLRDAQYVTDTATIQTPHEDGTVTIRTEETRRCVSPRQDTVNQVPTIFLDTPTHMGGDDYIVPALWRGAEMKHCVGWVFLRRGWPDMFHEHIGWTPSNAKLDVPEKLALLKLSHPTPASVTETLEEASRTYFRRTRGAEANLPIDQRRLRLIRKLRKIPALTREDSYGVRNCQPGTEAFIKALTSKLRRSRVLGDGVTCDGWTMAKAWYKAGYIEEDRFANVVNKLYQGYEAEERQQAAIQERLDQRIADAMAWDGGQLYSGNPLAHSQPYVPTQITSEDQLAADGSFIDLRAARRVAENHSSVQDELSQAQRVGTEGLYVEVIPPSGLTMADIVDGWRGE